MKGKYFVAVWMFCWVVSVPEASQAQWEEINLWPGESYRYRDVGVTWRITAPGTKGELTFRGPKTKIENIPLPEESLFAYLDGVAFYGLHPTEGGRRLIFRVREQSDRIPLTAAPWKEDVLFVSSFSPVLLGSWKLSVSKDAVEYPDGAQYLQLLAQDQASNTQVSLPATRKAYRKFGRFTVSVNEVCPPTKTVVLWVQADADTSIKGADAYVERFGFVSDEQGRMETYAEFFDRISAKYGFKVEWGEFPPGHPDSIEYAKKLSPTGTSSSNGILRDVLADKLAVTERSYPHQALALEWKDPYHLRVWAKNYDQVLAQRKDWEEQQREREQAKARFEEEYQLQTRVFPLKSITPSTANALVDNVITDYVLIGTEVYTRDEAERKWPPRQDGTRPYSIEAEVQEQAYADERSGSLIVTAVPKTMQKIEQILARVDGLLAEEKQSKPVPKQYRVEAILLQGQGTNTGRMALSFPVSGRLAELNVSPGTKVKAGDGVVRLDTEERELTLQALKAQLEQKQAALDHARKTLERTRQAFESGRMPSVDLENAGLAVKTAEAEQKRTEVEYQQAARQLSQCTLTAPVSGTITEIAQTLGASVAAGQTVAVLQPEPPSEGAARESASAAPLAAQYGISPEDLQMFEIASLRELGKGAVTLAAERGEAGRVKVSLTDRYACELEFQDVREPYLVVRGRLLDSEAAKTLLENTLYLEQDKPSLLGLTNLREALILVVRLTGEIEI